MKLMTVKQLMKNQNCINTKNYKVVKNNAKKELAMLCYEISKSKLPRLKTTKRKHLMEE